jgi:adenylate cyclase
MFVTRERQLERLNGFLHRALAAQGLVCFVTGEAGSGKTALVTEFARRAQEEHTDLVVAVGQSDAQTGAGDPYLPFREVLGLLTGDVEAKLAQGAITPENASRLRKFLSLSGRALVEVGPDLIEIFVPWAGLATRAAAYAADKVGWLDRMEQLVTRQPAGQGVGPTGIEQDHIFEQYTNVLNRLAEQQPLLLVLDDLHWADAASIDLLFRVGRRIVGSGILVVGTYRPEEVAIGRAGERHPLEKVLAEFRRYFGDIWVDLDHTQETEGRRFVNALLDTEPNRLDVGFRQALYHHTRGHPLFTIELLRDMQERGDLIHGPAGYWVEDETLDWATLPVRAEGVIEERVGRLREELRKALDVGSVEGERFTAEVIARVQSANARQLVRQLSGELEKKHRLITAQGVRHLAAQRLSLYQFQHNLFQAYLYNELTDAERTYLHEDVGLVLEELYGDKTDEIAVQLARHFEEAGLRKKAVHYLSRAGEQAAAQFANEEAIDYLTRALDLTPDEDISGRYARLMAREEIYALQGKRDAQKRDLVALDTLAENLDDGSRRAEVALRQARYARVTGDYAQSIAAAQSAVRLAQSAQDGGLEAQGCFEWGNALRLQAKYDAAQQQLERALRLARSAGQQLVEANCLHSLSIIIAQQGFSSQEDDVATVKTYENQALVIFRQMGNRDKEASALNSLGGLYYVQGDYARSSAYWEEALQLSREIGHRRGEGILLSNLGELMLMQGNYTQARVYLDQALSIHDKTGEVRGRCHALAHLGWLFHQLGRDEDALEACQEALALAQKLHDTYGEGTASTRLGYALVGLGRMEEAAGAYRNALAIWRESGPPSLAMEALAGLARISLAQHDLDQALAQVEEILSFLEDNTLSDADDAIYVYLTCYEVLKAVQDPRAPDISSTAYGLLQKQAAKISDGTMRRSFLENVPTHRQLMEAVKQMESS